MPPTISSSSAATRVPTVGRTWPRPSRPGQVPDLGGPRPGTEDVSGEVGSAFPAAPWWGCPP